MDKKTLRKLSCGMYVLTSAANGREGGCIINTAMQVASDPLRISISVINANYTRELVENSGKFNLSIISRQAGFELFTRFGFQSGRDVDKLAGFTDYERSANGLCYVTAGTCGYASATVEHSVNLGSHTLFIASIDDMELISDAEAATYAYYQSDIKPKSGKPAAAGKTAWRCSVCGYIYEGEELPADYICPLCKHPASDFEKTTV